jgi:CRP-like cAMP-binding protein
MADQPEKNDGQAENPPAIEDLENIENAKADKPRLIANVSTRSDFFEYRDVAMGLLQHGERDLLVISDQKGQPEYLIGRYQSLRNYILPVRDIQFKKTPYTEFDVRLDKPILSANINSPEEFFSNKNIVTAILEAGERDLLLLSDGNGQPAYIFSRYDQLKKAVTAENDIQTQHTPFKTFNVIPSAVKNASQAQERLLKLADKFAIFNGLKPIQILQLTKNVGFTRFRKNEMVFNKGSFSDDIYITLKGSIDLYDNEVPGADIKTGYLATLAPGTILGEMTPFTKETRSAKAIATGEENILLSFQINEQAGLEAELSILYKNVITLISDKLKKSNKEKNKG